MNTNEKMEVLVRQFARSRKDLADMIGFTPQTVSNWVYRDSIPKKGIDAICSTFPEVNRDWLLSTGTTTAFFVDNISPSCGDDFQELDGEGLVPINLGRRDVKYLLRCHGNSMEPRIYDGDAVAVGDPMGRYEQLSPKALYLIQTTSGQLMVKQATDPGPDCPYLQLATVNPDYHLQNDGHLPKEEIRTIYRVLVVLNNV